MDLTTPAGVDGYLTTTPYGHYHGAERLAGGFSGFVYRACLRDGYGRGEGAPSTVVVKHVQNYAAREASWRLDPSRLGAECRAMQLLAARPEFHVEGIRVPRMLYFDEASWVLIMEDVGDFPSLREWMRPGLVTSTDARDLGHRLGKFLAQLHNVTAGNTPVLEQFLAGKSHSSTQYIEKLAQAAAKYGYADDVFKKAAEQCQRDEAEGVQVLTLGDFYTGNVLISPGLEMYVLDMELAKPGAPGFDVALMAAEMYCTAAFRDSEVGMILLEAFLGSYRDARNGPVDVAGIAMRIGAHLMIMAPGAWEKEATQSQIRKEVDFGANLVRLGLGRDDKVLREGLLRCLYCTAL